MNKNEDIDIKLLEYLSGEISAADCEAVEKWIETSDENRLYFEDFRRNFMLMRWTFRAKLFQKHDFLTIRKKLAHKSSLRIWMRVAASVVILLGAGITLFLLRPYQEVPATAEIAAVIEPGKPQATLVLSSGVSVPIAAVNTELKEEDGTSIKIDDTGEVCYKGGGTAPDKTSLPVFNKMMIPRGGEFTLTLDDGTKVWLNSDTELKYPISFGGNERVVYLRGEAYFKVTKDSQHPFIVIVDDLRVKVYGTEFNVNTHTAGQIETVLVEGSVGIGKNAEVRMKPNEKADYLKTTGNISVRTVDVAPYIAWKDGNFIFQQETLESIMNKLSLWYDVDVSYANENLKTMRLSGDMKRYEEIKDLLYYFEKSSNITFKIEDRMVLISSGHAK